MIIIKTADKISRRFENPNNSQGEVDTTEWRGLSWPWTLYAFNALYAKLIP